jgi:hypothetical protein
MFRRLAVIHSRNLHKQMLQRARQPSSSHHRMPGRRARSTVRAPSAAAAGHRRQPRARPRLASRVRAPSPRRPAGRLPSVRAAALVQPTNPTPRLNSRLNDAKPNPMAPSQPGHRQLLLPPPPFPLPCPGAAASGVPLLPKPRAHDDAWSGTTAKDRDTKKKVNTDARTCAPSLHI